MKHNIDIDSVYNSILDQLNAAGKEELIAGLEQAGAGAVTGSEYLILTAAYLSSLELRHPETYLMIKDRVRDYKKYCRANGLLV